MMDERDAGPADRFVQKHLARNVPIDFMQCCERIRCNLAVSGGRRFGRGRPPPFRKIYKGMFEALGSEASDEDACTHLGQQIMEVQVRYEAIQKTLDQSVPAKPIFDRLSALKRALKRSERELVDVDRDEIVCFFNGHAPSELPSSVDAFESANSIAERAAISHAFVARMIDDLEQMIGYFDYKQGLVTRGNPSKFARAYAVSALASIFELNNSGGHSAQISQMINTIEQSRKNRLINARYYSGPFLDFLLGFFQAVDAKELARNNYEGFIDGLRKLTQSRRRDPQMHELVSGEHVAVDDILEFMKRADASK